MKRKNITSALIIACVLLFSCDKSIDVKSQNVKKILPGRWSIESFNLSANGTGTWLNGRLIYTDTVLTNFGIIEIPNLDEFNGDYSPYYKYIDCVYSLNNEQATINITRLFGNRQGTIVSFFLSSYIIGSDLGNYLNTSYMWSRNCIVNIDHENFIRLSDSNHPDKYQIILKRLL